MRKMVLSQEDLDSVYTIVEDAKVERKIGTSGLGNVYAIAHPKYGHCALKILGSKASKNRAFLEKFLQPLQKLQQISHPHIYQIYEIGSSPSFYILSEYLHGQSLLKKVLVAGKFNLSQANAILKQIVSGLECAYQQGITHRNLKLNNIFLTEKQQLKILDFSLPPTTPKYLSPEQCSGKKSSFASDIYSLGVIYYYLVTGAPPFRSGSAKAIMKQHLHAPCPNIPDLPVAYMQFLEKLLAKAPGERFHSYQELSETLAKLNYVQKNDCQEALQELTLEFGEDDEQEDHKGEESFVELTAQNFTTESLASSSSDKKVKSLSQRETTRMIRRIDAQVQANKPFTSREREKSVEESLESALARLEEACALQPYLENRAKPSKKVLRFDKNLKDKLLARLQQLHPSGCWMVKDLVLSEKVEVEIYVEQALIFHHFQTFESQISSALKKISSSPEKQELLKNLLNQRQEQPNQQPSEPVSASAEQMAETATEEIPFPSASSTSSINPIKIESEAEVDPSKATIGLEGHGFDETESDKETVWDMEEIAAETIRHEPTNTNTESGKETVWNMEEIAAETIRHEPTNTNTNTNTESDKETVWDMEEIAAETIRHEPTNTNTESGKETVWNMEEIAAETIRHEPTNTNTESDKETVWDTPEMANETLYEEPAGQDHETLWDASEMAAETMYEEPDGQDHETLWDASEMAAETIYQEPNSASFAETILAIEENPSEICCQQELAQLPSDLQEQVILRVDAKNYYQKMAWLEFAKEYELEKGKDYFELVSNEQSKEFFLDLQWLLNHQEYQKNISAIKAFFQSDYEIKELGRGAMGLVLRLTTKNDATILSLQPQNIWARNHLDSYLKVKEGADGKEIVYAQIPASTTFVVKVAFRGHEESLIGEGEILERFSRKGGMGQIIGLIQHGRLLPPENFDHQESLGYFLMMEYANQGNVDTFYKRFPDGRLPITIAFTIFYGLAQALLYLQESSIVHRDIKPANILIADSGLPKLSDFGLAISTEEMSSELSQERIRLLRLLDSEFFQINREREQIEQLSLSLQQKKQELSATGEAGAQIDQIEEELQVVQKQLAQLREQEAERAAALQDRYRLMSAQENALKGRFAGSLLYAAPEQFEPERILTPKCDVYQLAAVMYTLITGELPVQGDNVREIVEQICSEKKPQILELVPEDPVTQKLNTLLQQMMHLSIEERLSIQDVLYSLNSILSKHIDLLTEELSFNNVTVFEDFHAYQEKVAFAQHMHVKYLQILRCYVDGLANKPKQDKISFTCPSCQAHLHIYASMNGKRGRCPHCKHPIVVSFAEH